MAQVVGSLYASHGLFVALPPEEWEEKSKNRNYRSDVPTETFEEKVDKYDRTMRALAVLEEQLHAMKPDVLLIVGDDQNENFDFANYPALSVFVGEEFSGPDNKGRGKPELFHKVPGHPGLAVAVLRGLLERGFDPSFSMSDSNPAKGMCHAVMRPLEFFHTYEIPVVPVLVNAYYPPQLSAVRCYQIGKAVREAIDAYPEDLRVVVVGSGGLWHTPGRPTSYLDEKLDQVMIDHLLRGDILGMAEQFDAYAVPEGDASQDVSPGVHGMTGMPGVSGPQGGTRETCNWIGAAAIVDGSQHQLVDYIPIYSSPIGTAYAYCNEV